MKHFPGSVRHDTFGDFVARILALAALACLAGCSPTYDWREFRAEDGASRMLMPGKPARLTRPIDLGGMRVDMAMEGAQADDTAFTVGTVVLPSDDEASRHRAIEAMRQGMVRNIGGTERSRREITVPVIDAAGRTTGSVNAIVIEATGRMRDADAQLLALFVADGGRAWQCVVLGTRIDRLQADTFLKSFRVQRT